MRVLLARRFRGNSNASQLLEGEEEDPQGEVVDEQEEKEEPVSVSQFSQGQLASQQESQTNPPKNHSKSYRPREKLLFSGKTCCENKSPQQPHSLAFKQHQQLKPPTQRKRRLAKSGLEENDCKQRRRQTSVSSTVKEEASLLDRKPKAVETGIVGNNTKRTSIGNLENPKVLADTGENIIPADAAPSPSISKSAALPKSRSDHTKANSKQKMVSGGTGGSHQRRHGNSRERDEEEHLLNWQYSVNNGHSHHAVVRRLPANHEEPEVMTQSTGEAGFDCPLENDPASARGDVSSASPERQNHHNDHNRKTFVSGRREESPPQGTGTMRNAYDQGWMEHPTMNAPMYHNRRDASRIASVSGSERGTNSLHAFRQSGSYGGNSNKKRASTTAEEMRFRAILKKERGLEIREQDGDGNCLFRAISLQVYGDPSMHGDVRKQCMDHMVSDWLVNECAVSKDSNV